MKLNWNKEKNNGAYVKEFFLIWMKLSNILVYIVSPINKFKLDKNWILETESQFQTDLFKNKSTRLLRARIHLFYLVYFRNALL